MSTTQTHLMTAEELMNLQDESNRHALIKGELLTMPPPKSLHGRVTANLTMLLLQHAKAKQLGDVHTESGYKLESNPDTVLGPDVSFISRGRVDRADDGYYDGPPDLAVEVLSPGDRKGWIERKLALWLETGTRSVWLVNPQRRTVELISSTGNRQMLHEDDELVDEVVAGFRVKVSEIFE